MYFGRSFFHEIGAVPHGVAWKQKACCMKNAEISFCHLHRSPQKSNEVELSKHPHYVQKLF